MGMLLHAHGAKQENFAMDWDNHAIFLFVY